MSHFHLLFYPFGYYLTLYLVCTECIDKYVCTVMLYNILLINWYMGNITTKCHSGSMDDNTCSCKVLHQKIYSLPVSIASDTRCF